VADPAQLVHVRRLAEELATRGAERSLRTYLRQAWPVLEPETAFTPGWHLDAICDHAEAVLTGQIRNLLINIAPRHSKSTIISKAFPTWAWIARPEKRFMYASYSASLSIEHAVNSRRVIDSPWYQERWGGRFRLTSDQNIKSHYENDHRGYRISTSVGGTVTGRGGDILVCLPPDEMVWTEAGRVPIGAIVRERQRRRVASYNVQSGRMSWQPIVGWHANPGRPIVEVILSDGSALRCTADHRIWTTTRGWVEAGALSAVDVLPRPTMPDRPDRARRDAVATRTRALGLGRFADRTHGVIAELRPAGRFTVPQVTVPAQASGDVGPRATLADALNSAARDIVLGRQLVGRVTTDGDRACLVARHLRAGSTLEHGKRPVALGVPDVLAARAVREIAEAIIGGASIEMPRLFALRGRADEREQDDLVDPQRDRTGVASRVEMGVALAVAGRFQESFSDADVSGSAADTSLAPDAAVARDAVQPVESGDRSPVLVRTIGHEPVTYCVTVATNGTFVAGDGEGVIISNCDDPHNLEEIDSDDIRKRDKKWYRTVWSTRLNDPKTGSKIVIMQRGHEDDLSADLIATGDYVHLNLPTEYVPRVYVTVLGWQDPRTDPGALLCPARFGATENAVAKKELGDAYAGQHGQAPSPPQGKMFQRAWFGVLEVLPTDTIATCRGWDMAGTADGGDWTAGVRVSKTAKGRYVIEHVVRDQIASSAVDDLLLTTAQMDGRDVAVREEQEGGSAGKNVIASHRKMLGGYDFDGVAATGEKSTRWRPLAAQCRAGNVDLLAGDWNQDFVDEIVKVPGGKHDDQVDAAAVAFNHVALMSNDMSIVDVAA
jgi:predicted phage terminase large subunit-like protein